MWWSVINMARWNTSIMDIIVPNLIGGTSEGITDSTGQLSGQFRDDFLGTRGYEVFHQDLNTDTASLRFARTNIIIDENAATLQVEVLRSGNTRNNVTVDFSTLDDSAISPENHTRTTGTLTFNAGEVSKLFSITIEDDTVVKYLI